MFASRHGFLGTGAPFSADLNLIVQLAMGLALAAGAALARRKLYRARRLNIGLAFFLERVQAGFNQLHHLGPGVIP